MGTSIISEESSLGPSGIALQYGVTTREMRLDSQSRKGSSVLNFVFNHTAKMSHCYRKNKTNKQTKKKKTGYA